MMKDNTDDMHCGTKNVRYRTDVNTIKENMNCLRCGGKMVFIGSYDFQLGRAGWLLGDLPHLIEGSMALSVYRCPDCGKVEFFSFEESEIRDENMDRIAQVCCPKCKQMHDMDYPKCPHCGHRYV